jgi:hypothetical protein
VRVIGSWAIARLPQTKLTIPKHKRIKNFFTENPSYFLLKIPTTVLESYTITLMSKTQQFISLLSYHPLSQRFSFYEEQS